MSTEYESIFKKRIGSYDVRVWVAEKELGSCENGKEVLEAIYQLHERNHLFILKEVSQIKNVSAVEVLSENGEGYLVYNNWP